MDHANDKSRELQPLVAPAEGLERLDQLGEEIAVLMRGLETGAGYDVLLWMTPPGSGPPRHIHHDHDENFYILEGELVSEVAGQRRKLGPGMYAFNPRGIEHGYRNLGSQPCRFLIWLSPAGHIGFFDDIKALNLPSGPPDLQKLAPILEKHGIEATGPPLEEA